MLNSKALYTSVSILSLIITYFKSFVNYFPSLSFITYHFLSSLKAVKICLNFSSLQVSNTIIKNNNKYKRFMLFLS